MTFPRYILMLMLPRELQRIQRNNSYINNCCHNLKAYYITTYKDDKFYEYYSGKIIQKLPNFY